MPSADPLLLAIDTANLTASVALMQGTHCLHLCHDPTPSKQAERLFPLVSALFSATGYGYTALQAIGVSIGPGSFTGIRIGMAAARGIALAAHLPVIGVTTLEAAAYTAKDGVHPVYAILDARRGQYYAQPFDATLTPLAEAILAGPEALVLPIGDTPFILTGSGAMAARETARQQGKRFLDAEGTANPETIATAIGAVAASRLASGIMPALPRPFYIRPPDASPGKNRNPIKERYDAPDRTS